MPDGTIWLKKIGNSLVPTDDKGRKLFGLIKENVMVMTNVRTPRNPDQHRFIWHLARIVHENSERFESAEHVLEQIKIGTGYSVRTLLSVPGVGDVWQVRGKSIAYESMNQSDFADWLDMALDYIVVVIIPGLSRDDLREQVQSLMAPAPKHGGR